MAAKKFFRNFEQLVSTPTASFNEEWTRLQTFNSWPFQQPRPADLAKAGLFYAPAGKNNDRCECFSCGKAFMEWEPEDDPLEAHKANVPSCPFIIGRSNNVPIPSAYGVSSKRTTSEGSGGLSSYLSSLTEGHSPQILPMQPIQSLSSGSSAATPLREAIKYPEPPVFPRNQSLDTRADVGVPDSLVPRAVEDLAPIEQNDVDADELVVRLQRSNAKKGGKRGKSSHVVVLEKEQKRREQMVSDSTMEWTAFSFMIENSTSALKKLWGENLDVAQGKVDNLETKLRRISQRAAMLRGDDWLEGKKNALREVQAAIAEAQKKRSQLEEELQQLGQRTSLERRELARLAHKEELLAEYEEQSRAKSAALQDLETRSTSLTKEIEKLEQDRERLTREQRQIRFEFMENIESLKKEKLIIQAELVDTRDALERKKSELEIYDIKLRDWSRREEIALTMEKDLLEREQVVVQREREVRAREETLAKREAELKEAMEATRRARMKGGRNAAPPGMEGEVVEAADMWEPEDDELETKREELLGMMAQ